jgi:hypothetical protein
MKIKDLSVLVLCAFAGFNSVTSSARELDPRFEEADRNEAQYIQDIREGILSIQTENRTNGRLLRGTHSKGVCANATFEVLQGPGQRPGLFRAPGRYPAVLRFANAKSEILPDPSPDVRALSIGVELPESLRTANVTRQDFSMNNFPTFPIRNAYVFSLLMRARANAILWPHQYLLITEAINNGFEQQNQPLAPYQTLTYYSGVPFAYGANHAAKFSVRPCAGIQSQPLDGSDLALQNELSRFLRDNAAGACLEFRVQVLAPGQETLLGRDLSAVDMVENATIEWDEDLMPFTTVAKIWFDRGGVMDAETCERQRFNVNRNALPALRGLGSINRAREGAEEASAERRLAPR